MILINQKLLERVLDNIVSNAVQYVSKEAELELDFKTDKDYLGVSIADNGPGVTKSALKHALEQFYQGDQSCQAGNKYIIAQIMKQHHGEVLLSNHSNDLGAIVTLKFPIC
ncbi:sensor histidine kinase [Ligilactobacillus equi]|uniref:histidine kinase n=1 Tax=Ligilactobacillus equi DPC 6820 TaxID=1392007 RepID=V7HW35_9LACO|nr:ATP-binding protein [Ligilactobacillus equi]ETA74449.1 ATPase/histidine kinase/DNA gyrase B/HSP90 domain protein [Ligilactobacillus equi DPC 6820]